MPEPVRLRLSRRAGGDLRARSRAANGLDVTVVSRPGPFGNPFGVGDRVAPETAADLYRWALDPPPEAANKLAHREWRQAVLDRLPEIRGRNLACWCRLCPRHAERGKPFTTACASCAPCHADVLGEMANRPLCEEVRP